MSREPGLRGRLLIGAIAGIAGVLATTYAMNELHRRRRNPRGGTLPVEPPDEAAIDVGTASQFAYGAACGTVLSAVNPRVGPVGGALAGAGLWVVSSLGWLPGMDMVRPAALLPRRRNAFAIGIHLIWGAATALALRDLLLARDTIVANKDDTLER